MRKTMDDLRAMAATEPIVKAAMEGRASGIYRTDEEMLVDLCCSLAGAKRELDRRFVEFCERMDATSL